MKHTFLMMAALVLCLGTACPSTRPVRTVPLRSNDSTDHADFSMYVDFPLAGKGALAEIRNTVMDVVDSEMGFMAAYEGDRVIPAYAGDASDTDAWFQYYRIQGRERLEQMALEDVSDREAYILSDEDFTPEEKDDMLSMIPRWEFDYQFEKLYETPRYVVFQSLAFVYLGGAHGGISGAGPLTIDKRSGVLLTGWFLPEAEDAMQDLLVEGLQAYFSDEDVELSREELLEHLFIEDGHIPLPVWNPMPTKDGLELTYQQYEIASYAEGMPSLTLPYKTVAPFLTPAARALLKI